MKSLTTILTISLLFVFMGGCVTDGQFSQYGRSGGISGGFYDQTGGVGYALQQAVTPGMVRGGAIGALAGVAMRKDVGRTAATGALIGVGLEMLSQAGQPPRQGGYYQPAGNNPGVEGSYHQGYGQGRQELQRDLEQNAYNAGRAAGYGYR